MAAPEKSTGDSVRVTRWRPAPKGSTPIRVSVRVGAGVYAHPQTGVRVELNEERVSCIESDEHEV